MSSLSLGFICSRCMSLKVQLQYLAGRLTGEGGLGDMLGKEKLLKDLRSIDGGVSELHCKAIEQVYTVP